MWKNEVGNMAKEQQEAGSIKTEIEKQKAQLEKLESKMESGKQEIDDFKRTLEQVKAGKHNPSICLDQSENIIRKRKEELKEIVKELEGVKKKGLALKHEIEEGKSSQERKSRSLPSLVSYDAETEIISVDLDGLNTEEGEKKTDNISVSAFVEIEERKNRKRKRDDQNETERKDEEQQNREEQVDNDGIDDTSMEAQRKKEKGRENFEFSYNSRWWS